MNAACENCKFWVKPSRGEIGVCKVVGQFYWKNERTGNEGWYDVTSRKDFVCRKFKR